MIGKNRKQVEELLGQSDCGESENTISYCLGFPPEFLDLGFPADDMYELIIEFENGKVIKVHEK